MSCRHGNHEDGCEICEEVEAARADGTRSSQAAQHTDVGTLTHYRLPESIDGDIAGHVLFWDDHFKWWTQRDWNCEDARAYRLWMRMPPVPAA